MTAVIVDVACPLPVERRPATPAASVPPSGWAAHLSVPLLFPAVRSLLKFFERRCYGTQPLFKTGEPLGSVNQL